MKNITVWKKKINNKDFIFNKASIQHANVVITDPCNIYDGDTDEKIIHYSKLSADELKNTVCNLEYNSSQRTQGIVAQSRVFGFSPRHSIRNNFCSTAKFSIENAQQNSVICNFATAVQAIYAVEFNEIFNSHLNVINQDILPQWRIDNTVFTSGIINKNSSINYHCDAGNYAGYRSCMVNFRHNISGGLLVIPQYDIAFCLQDSSVIIFDGATILHGVSEVIPLSDDYFRHSVVYYSLKGLKHCLNTQHEVQNAQSFYTKVSIRKATL
jgi:hypothetical protein